MFNLELTEDRDINDSRVLDYISSSLFPSHDIFDCYGNLANISALLYWYLDSVNWVGFYLSREKELVLGPFQGEPACFLIPFTSGVCGYAAIEKRSIIVEDVALFPGHIACSSKSKSEIVIPLVENNELWGVLDIDSPILSRFDFRDQAFLEKVCKLLSKSLSHILLKSSR